MLTFVISPFGCFLPSTQAVFPNGQIDNEVDERVGLRIVSFPQLGTVTIGPESSTSGGLWHEADEANGSRKTSGRSLSRLTKHLPTLTVDGVNR
jgi:hypothetical protein